MNIKKAKEQIADTVRAYLEKDEYGRSIIPQHKQRPIFLMGPPGIGKTEIMSQVASELGIGLLSYSMTHHTRQSALGLPIIKQREYGGEVYDVSIYTMSEIIAAVYELMESSGVESGILFLDEINCVSETLTPIMLQFLQYKVFGGHKLPEGWIVVTAGNPPEYNNMVREFDIVTWDRLKRIDIEPDLTVWKEYARSTGIHGAVVTYLDIKPQNFYKIETTVSGKSFVTARGWEDLSRMLFTYEHIGIEADKELISQYLQNRQIAEDFALYYEIYKKYRSDYRIDAILDGTVDKGISERASRARFDERYSLLGLLLEAVTREAAEIHAEDAELMIVKRTLGELKAEYDGKNAADLLAAEIEAINDERTRLKAANALSYEKDNSLLYRRELLERYRRIAGEGFNEVRAAYMTDVERFKAHLSDVKRHMDNSMIFCEKTFGGDRELLILVTELAADPVTARFISNYGCDEYYKHDSSLMLRERKLEIISELDRIERESKALE
ncbi:MAG: AAA family ATPase [Ruminococcus sp.]|nr:AAA family ATPase [Ruminococcus sp.]